jgi:HAD superfamily hydrolase (TIGR01509 family)
MALDGMLLDLDGTLVNTNGLHADAWVEALASENYRVGRDRIEQELGKGGDQLVPALLGHDADEHDGEALRAAQGKIFERLARAHGVEPAPGAEVLLAELRRRGIKTALATSSKLEQLKVIEETSRVRWLELVDVVTRADEVAASKPQPDIVQAAVDKLGLAPTQCALVGDTPWDALSGVTSGVVVIGLTYGGNDAASLLRGGARCVCSDTAEVLAGLDSLLTRSSPGSAHLTQTLLEELMREALLEAAEGLERGELPVGAVVTDGAARITSRARDHRRETNSVLACAELRALHSVPKQLEGARLGGLLVTTLEPGPMVVGAAIEAGIDTIIYALPAVADAGVRRVVGSESGRQQLCRVYGRVLERESRGLFQRWLADPQRHREHDHVVKELTQTSVQERAA